MLKNILNSNKPLEPIFLEDTIEDDDSPLCTFQRPLFITTEKARKEISEAIEESRHL